MSQSDYIQYKRITREMAEMSKFPTKMPSVIESGKYILYKEYSLENTILNNDTSDYDKLDQPNTPIVFGMVKKCVVADQNMIMCRGTDKRPNRVLVTRRMFNHPSVNDIPKQTRMGWNTISDNKMCKCLITTSIA